MIRIRAPLSYVALAACVACHGAQGDDLQGALDRSARGADASADAESSAADEPDAGTRSTRDASADSDALDAASDGARSTSTSGDAGSSAGGLADAGSLDAMTSQTDATTSPPPDATSGMELKLAFAPMYSAYDGRHTFKVPLRVQRSTGRLTVTTTPSGFVDAVPTAFGLMLTTRQAGSAVVVVRDDVGNTGSASLTITPAGASDYERGDAQYHTQADAGVNPPACASCHVAGEASGVDPARVDVEHTPQQLAGYSDEDLIAIFSEGKKPLGAGFRIVNGGGLIPDSTAARIFAGFHAWPLDEATRRGLVIYLRGLEPKTQGTLDFGGLYTAQH